MYFVIVQTVTMEHNTNQIRTCGQCGNEISGIIYKAHMFDKCLKCITNNNINLVQQTLLKAYNNARFNQKQAINCNRCKLDKVVSFCIYANIYPLTDKKIIIPTYGEAICLQCIIELANNKDLFIG